MRVSLLRLAIATLFFLSLAGCKEDDPYKKNRSVRPTDYLSAEDYTSLTVEIVYVEGFQPSSTSVEALKTFIESLCNKPSGINVIERSIASPGANVYTIETLQQIEFEQRSVNTKDDRLTAFIFFADGEYVNSTEDSKILGLAYDYSSMAIFENSIQENSSGAGMPSTAKLETTSMTHEFGHILGLVNNGTSMVADHHDDEHPGHCDNTDCLMYYRVESSDIVQDLFGQPVPTLDSNCLADLHNAGGK